jgi:hypothetical protein
LRAGYARFFGGRTIMKRTVSEDAALAGARGRAGWLVAAVPEAARRPLRELMDDRLPYALLSEPVRMLSQRGDLASRRSFRCT